MFKRTIIKFEIASIYLLGEKAYLPTKIRFETEQAVDGEPVYICDIQKTELVKALEKVLEAQKVRLPLPESMDEIFKNAKFPMLRATKTRNWKQLAKISIVYSIEWTNKEVRLSISQLDRMGRFEFTASNMRSFPPNISLDELVEIIIQNYRSR